jgi:Fic/DOC family protein
MRLRLTASAASKERRLAELLGGCLPDAALGQAVREAQVVGSLGLSGIPATVDDVRAAIAGGEAAPAASGLLRAMAAVDPKATLTVDALVAWHRAATGASGLRSGDAERPGGMPPAPPEFIAGRLAIFEQWMNAPSASELTASQQGALALARVVEVKPFDDGNGRVSRLAASHLMVRAGARPPILVPADAPRLEQALSAAFQLHTEPLAALLAEASERALDVMIREAERSG